MSDEHPVRFEVADRVATITLDRPEARNSLSSTMRRELPAAMARADADEAVDVIILTGSDPAFCAGLDLKELGARGSKLADSVGTPEAGRVGGPWTPTAKPVIGAVNGAAITGGFEVALNCDFLIASERARFADTHSRVGVMPGWGLTVLLAEAVGMRRARQLSYSGNFLTAHDALAWGLVNHVVDHDELLPFCRRLAADIVGNDQAGVRRMKATYDAVTAVPLGEGWQVEHRMGQEWAASRMDLGQVEQRRQAIMERGRKQL
ncbi:MAG: enoyl-CoA hydratase [Acidimicrobiales bacterium]|nr:enoyl-CoA hydratase [Acidimicrobiales bacterium]